MEAIILAGGRGTRLQTVVKNLPKPMAEINGFPFLKYLLDMLAQQGITTIILSVGYQQAIIKDYFQNNYLNMSVIYSSEDAPLGTGGAILQALNLTQNDDVYVLNGDTFFEVDLKKMRTVHIKTAADITLATKLMHKFNRYGVLKIEEGLVTGFEEKKYHSEGHINGGLYLIKKDLFNRFQLKNQFSFESDFLEKTVQQLSIKAFSCDGYFIDIGIPKDYELASTVFHGE